MFKIGNTRVVVSLGKKIQQSVLMKIPGPLVYCQDGRSNKRLNTLTSDFFSKY